MVTPDRVVLSDEAVSLTAPGSEGYLGILANHAALVTELGVGELRYTDTHQREHRLAVSGGFMEVGGNQATVLADAAERAGEIDTDRARQAQDRAQQDSENLQAAEPGPEHAADLRRLTAEIQRAENRLRIAGGR